MNMLKLKLTKWMGQQPDWVFALVVSLAAFLTYSCMYAFRKPFAVGTFDGLSFWGIDYKIWLITSQVLGYTLSKFLGIKYISELKSTSRGVYILVLVGIAEIALLLFWVVPRPYNIIFM